METNQDPAQREHGGKQRDHDADQRDYDAGQRDDHGQERDHDGDERDQHAVQRDNVADRRDHDAQRRDHEAEQRDHEAQQRDREADQRDHDAAARDERDEQRDRLEALAAEDDCTEAYDSAALTRKQAAADRSRASSDRRAAASHRAHAQQDRDIAMADREAGANGRDSSELDRDTAMNDRAASAQDRKYASQLATSLEFGWTMMQIDPAVLLYASPGYLKILGLDPAGDSPTLAAVESMIHPSDLPRIRSDYLNPEASRGAVEIEMRILRADGVVRWIRATSNPVSDSDGGVTRAAATVEDITGRKITEAATHSAQEEAERANAAKSEFLSRMSHELRTPLNAVLGFAQLLELDPLSDYQTSAVRHILRGGRHLLEMINDVLDISRIETDQLELSTTPVPVSELLIDTIGLMRLLAADNRVEIRLDPARLGKGLYVLADLRRLRQVVLNLLSNAIKYNRPGGRVDISCQVSEAGHLTLTVADQGIGIRPEDMPRLFTPFERLDAETSVIEGTGIGLALSQRLVAIMDGRIEVKSEFGVGSTFSVIMPLTESPSGPLVEHDDGELHNLTTPVVGSTMLYIEDNLSNVELVRRIVERTSVWGLTHCGRGGPAIELAAQLAPTLILLDLNLPDMNGIDVLRALRRQPATADTPIVIVSADASLEQTRRVLAAGADEYMTKPLDVSEVIRTLARYATQRDLPAA